MGEELEAKPIPAATVVVYRQGRAGIEVVMCRRNSTLRYLAGAWVFPGGRVDPKDRASHHNKRAEDDALTTAAMAAVREAKEETNLTIDPSQLFYQAHWTTPEGRPRRYASHYFFVDANSLTGVQDLRHDGEEILEAQWVTPERILEHRNSGTVLLAPPTFVTLWRLHHEGLSMLSRPPERILPRPVPVSGGVVSLYPGDAGYARLTLEVEGPRHRAQLLGDQWRYERPVHPAVEE